VKTLAMTSGLSALLLMFAAAGTTVEGRTDTVTLNVVTAWTKDSDWERGFWVFTEKVKELSNGRINLRYVGGPEAVPPFELIEAVRTGVVDLATNAGSYFSSVIREGDAMKLSELTPWEERESGAYGKLREILAGHGVHYLGRYHTPGVEFNFYTRNRINSTADFKGVRLRISPLYRSLALALGIVPVTMPHAEIYTALERGVVDGLGAGNIGIYEQGHHKFIRYIVEPGFYGNDQCIIMNLNKWNALPKDLQEILTEAAKQAERETHVRVKQQVAEERRKLLEAGLQVAKLSDADTYSRLAKEKGWEDVMKVAPKTGPELKKLLTK
jgi:TRAP-type C4-dicarboxylate transport system substrate-binding protein